MLDAFLASRRQGMSKHTLLFYQRCLSKAISIELSPQGISLFLANLRCGNAKHSYFRAIRAFCNWSYKEGLVKDNPIDRVDTPIVAKKLLPSITIEQFSLLIEATDNLRDKCIVSLLFDSGLRLSEIANIEVSNIDWNSNILSVVVKGNREAKAVFTPKTATLLKTYLANNGHNSKGESNLTLFSLQPRGIQDMLSKLSVKVGFPSNAHSFRRGFACNLHRKGLSTLSIMHLGRWSSLDMVQRYTKSITFDDCLELYQKVNSQS
jgi:integrase/recombinase XerC